MSDNFASLEMKISTEELSNLLMNGFDGEDGVKPYNERNADAGVSDLDMPKVERELFDDEGNFLNTVIEDAESFPFPEDDEDYGDADSIDDSRNVSEFDDDKLYSIAGENYEVAHIEKAIEAYKDISQYNTHLSQHLESLIEAEEEFNKLQTLAYGQIDATIQYYDSVMNDPRTNDAEYRIAMNETRKAQAQKDAIEAEYVKAREIMNQKKQQAESLKGLNMRNELIHSHKWNNEDFQAIGEYIQSNGINLKGEAVNTQLMLALRKAAAFDANRNKAKIDADKKTVQALRGTPSTKPTKAPESTTSDSAKAKAQALANNGTLKQEDMFQFLKD